MKPTYYGLVRVRAEKDGRLTPLYYTVGDEQDFNHATVVNHEYTIAIGSLPTTVRSHEEARAAMKEDLGWFKPLLKLAQPEPWFAAGEESENAADAPQGKHCDDYIHDFTAPHCLRFFLLVHRMPALDMALCREFGVKPELFATYRGERVRVVVASRMGDVGITRQLNTEDGYQERVMIADLSDFGDAP
jgi:hypothetical protein